MKWKTIKQRLEEENAVIYKGLQCPKRERLGAMLDNAELGTRSGKQCSTNSEMLLYKWLSRIPECCSGMALAQIVVYSQFS